MNELEEYFWRKPTEIISYYDFRILGYVNVAAVAFGLFSCIFGMQVLTNERLISPINTIFIHYGGNSIISGLVYMPRTYHELFRAKLCSIPEHNTFAWEMISYYSSMLAATFRHFAVWMAMMIGVWRYVAVLHPLQERHFCNMEMTRKVILAGYVLIFFGTSLPLYLATDVGSAVKSVDEKGCLTAKFTAGRNVTIYEFQVPLENYPFWYYLGMSLVAVFVKFSPSCISALISIRLIKTLIDARKKRREMAVISGRKNSYNERIERQMRRKTDRTTVMLLMILALFVIGEVPHGIYSMLTAFYGPKFFWKYWYPALEALNSLTHVSEAFKFPVYYTMNREFRETFKALFKRNSKNNKIVSQNSNSSVPQNSTSGSPSIATVSSNADATN